MEKNSYLKKHLIRDCIVIFISVILTLALTKIGFISYFLYLFDELEALGSFVSGFFFTSIFTITFSTIAFTRLLEVSDPVFVAFWGSLGAMAGDLVLFLFIRDVVADDIKEFVKNSKAFKIFKHHHLGFFRWLGPIFGGIIIASPLPDELGISLLGFAKTKTKFMLALSFVFNFIGILALAYLVKGVIL